MLAKKKKRNGNAIITKKNFIKNKISQGQLFLIIPIKKEIAYS